MQVAKPAANRGEERRNVVVGYVSVDAKHRDRATPELRMQANEVLVECERRGLSLLEIVSERAPMRGRALERPGLRYALERIAAGQAQGLVVAHLSRLAQSVLELGRVLESLDGWSVRLVTAAPTLDTEEHAGLLAMRTLIEVSRSERERLAERTRAGMRAARRKGPPSVADHLQLKAGIARMRADGMTLQAIADRLNAEGVPTVRGGAKWRPSSIQTAAGYRRPPPGEVRGLARDRPPAATMHGNR